MAKKIFKSNEVKIVGSKVLIAPPKISRPRKKKEEEVEEAVEVTELGETEEVKEVKAEVVHIPSIEEEKEKILEEAKKIKEDAEKEAERIKQEAEETAFRLVQQKTVEARKIKEDTENEAKRIVEDANLKAEQIIKEAEEKAEEILEKAREEAFESGFNEGFQKGEEEVKRLIDRLHIILQAAIDKRKEIIKNAESQLIDLVLLIARKVVKTISEEERNVVIENIKEALKKIRGEAEITIRVNIKDLEITTRQRENFISMVESLENVRIEEDSRVDPGGCIIETSFGDIDARIQTQLNIIEEKIREIAPLNGK
ncbi:MAG: flagellar assembly protein FliH [Spirochaetes bacterium]|nr:MAG: flagellar assembly protein FliH [Spirochaetota bacterium]